MNFNKNIFFILMFFISTNFVVAQTSSNYDKSRVIRAAILKKNNEKLNKKIPVIKENYNYPYLGHSYGLQNYPGKTMYPTQNSVNMPFATGRSFAGNDVTF